MEVPVVKLVLMDEFVSLKLILAKKLHVLLENLLMWNRMVHVLIVLLVNGLAALKLQQMTNVFCVQKVVGRMKLDYHYKTNANIVVLENGPVKQVLQRMNNAMIVLKENGRTSVDKPKLLNVNFV